MAGQLLVADYCGHGNETSDIMKVGEFIDI